MITTLKSNILKAFGIIFLFVMTVTVTTSCEDNELSDFEEVLVGNDGTEGGDQDNGSNGDTSNLITYENTAKIILDTNCIECHNINNANAGVRLENFQSAFSEADSGRMIARMTNQSSPMPPSGNLPDNVIQDIIDWIEDGLLEN